MDPGNQGRAMGVLIAGLILFIGAHALRVVRLRGAALALLGPQLHLIVISLLSAAGLALIIYGKILAHPPQIVWAPPPWTRFAPLVATPIGAILVMAAYAPSHLRKWTRHPMTLGVLIWAAGHLVANGDLASLVLFASLAAWSLLLAIAAFGEGGGHAGRASWSADMIAVVLGLALATLTAVFHMQLFGVAVIGFASESPPSGI